MNHNLTVSASININANATKVWEALTNPDIIKEYLFGTETITNWQVGSDVIFQGEYEGTTYKDKGVVQQNIPEKLLSYTYWSGFSGLSDEPENYSLVTYILVDNGDNTTNFTWTQKGYATEEGYNHSQSGMADFLVQIKEIMER